MDMHHFLSTHEMTYKQLKIWGAWMSSEEETNDKHKTNAYHKTNDMHQKTTLSIWILSFLLTE
jgi:hypothetical protein